MHLEKLGFSDADPGSGTFLTPESGIRDGDSSDPGWKNVGSGINIPDPQHCIGWDIRNQEQKN
jgi:hypothetical protein